MWQQPDHVTNPSSAWGHEPGKHYFCPVWWSVKHCLDSRESNRYSREKEPSLLQAVPAFVTVGSLTCLGCVFLAVKTCADDWELLTPQHGSTLLDLLASISHSSASPQKSSFFALFSPLLQGVGTAMPLLCACIIGAASHTLHCEAWKDFGESGNSCSSLNCPAKWPLASCCVHCLSCKLSSAWGVSEWGTQRWCKMLFKACLIKKGKNRKEWTFLSFSDPL